jgi:AcrR family transcriptional regulator
VPATSTLARQRAAEYERRRHLDAYFKLSADRDIFDVRVSDVVEAAGSCNAAFYRGFSSKDELMLAVAHERAGRAIETVNRRLPKEPSATEILTAWVETILGRASTAKSASETRAFALERQLLVERLVHEFPQEVSATMKLLSSPIEEALAHLDREDRAMRVDAIHEMVLSLLGRYIAFGKRPSKRQVEQVVGICLQIAGLA